MAEEDQKPPHKVSDEMEGERPIVLKGFKTLHIGGL